MKHIQNGPTDRVIAIPASTFDLLTSQVRRKKNGVFKRDIIIIMCDKGSSAELNCRLLKFRVKYSVCRGIGEGKELSVCCSCFSSEVYRRVRQFKVVGPVKAVKIHLFP